MLTALEFTALMRPLGPFDAERRVAVAVSGGADSLALAVLAAAWGTPLALVVDHGLRASSADEARLTLERLASRGISARLLTLRVAPGPGLAARARAARYEALIAACETAGLPQLLLGHHAGDQAETVLLRALHGSGPDGRAGMAPVQRIGGVCLVRPLLDVAPVRLRETLRAAGMAWVEDPSNQDQKAERARLRARIAEPDGAGPRTRALLAASWHWAARRDQRGRAGQAWLAASAILYPGLHAELPDAPMPAGALSALIQTVTGAAYPPPIEAVRQLAVAPRPATLGGARLLRGKGRLHVAREAAAMAPAVAARPGVVWDGRFRLIAGPAEATLGGLGRDAAAWRRQCDLPAAVLATLPCLRAGPEVIAIPHLGIGDAKWRLLPAVNRPATSTPLNSHAAA